MRTVLIAVCGLAPQVITETLYALHQQNRLPDVVRVLTTRAGMDICHAQLFAGGQGQYYQFLQEYQIDPAQIDFNPKSIICIGAENNRFIDDICDEDDNCAFLEMCMQLAFQLSSDPNTTIYYSIAGGRKTMGSCLSLTAQLYGRPQDRIFHVLVTPEFENNRDFYYPPNPPREITLFDNRRQPYQKNTSYAQVQLVPLPFFPMRDKISDPLLQQVETPSSLLMSLIEEDKPQLILDLNSRKIIWKNCELDISPALLAVYAFFAEQKKLASCANNRCRGCSKCFLTVPQVLAQDNQLRIAELYRRIKPNCDAAAMSDTGINSLSAENFNSTRSKLNRKLEDHFGAYEKETIQLAPIGVKPGVCYGLKLGREQIVLRW